MMRHYQLKFLTLLRMILFNFVIGNAQMTPEFLDHPMSINTIDGTTVEFTCTANNNPVILIFSINNNGVPTQNGFRELPEVLDIGGGVKRKRLKVTASANNNNSSIICRAYYDNDLKSVSSDEAILLVQGPLSSVVDLSDSFINASTVNISWSPPFTLPGTEITGYNISVISNGTTTNYFTSDSYYELLLTDIADSPCNEINVTVLGYNGLNGENELLTGIYLPSATIKNPVPVSISISSKRLLSAVFDISNLCDGQHPENAIFFLYINGSLVDYSAINHSSFVLSGENIMVNNLLMVSEDTNYTLVVSFSNLAGAFGNLISIFNTFSIESVAITDTTDGRVCVECVFASFSTDSVCTVELVSNNTVQYSKSFTGSIDRAAIASGCISDVISGVYRIRILNGKGKAVDMSLLPSNNTVNFFIITPTTVTSDDSQSSDTSAPSSTTVIDLDEDDGSSTSTAYGMNANE